MSKPGITIEIPGFGDRHLKTMVSDYTGTHSRGGKLVVGVKERLTLTNGNLDAFQV